MDAEAQEARAAGLEIEEVVVTARRVEENVQDVPVAVSAFSGQKIRELVINNNMDISKLAPNLMTDAGYGSPTNSQAAIRGFGGTATNGVQQYFAEIPNFQISYFDLASVQVLKGPQGTLFGETQLGGAILYEPVKADASRFAGYVRGEVGSYSARLFEGAVNLPVINDRLGVRLAVLNRQRDGYSRTIQTFAGGNTIDMDNVDEARWRLSVVFKPFDGFQNDLIYSGSRVKSNGTAQYLYWFNPANMNPAFVNGVPSASAATAANFAAFAGFPPPAGQTWSQILAAERAKQVGYGPRLGYSGWDRRRETIFNGLINKTSWEILDNLTVRNIASVYWTKEHAHSGTADFDGTPVPVLDNRYFDNPADGVGNGDADRTGGWPARVYTEELQLIGNLFDERLKWQVGGYYRTSGNREFGPASSLVFFGNYSGGVAAPATCTSFGVASPCTTMTHSRSKQYAIYGQATFAVTDTFNLTGGLRETWDSSRTYTAAGPSVFINLNGTTQTVTVAHQQPSPNSRTTVTATPSDGNLTYNITADWKPADDILVYGTHRTGFIGGGINALAPVGSELRAYDPAKVENYEVGVKADWMFGEVRGRTNIALYNDKFSDIHRTSFFIVNGAPASLTSNLASARYRGLEIETTIIPTTWFELTANLGLMRNKYQNWVERTPCAGSSLPGCVGLPAGSFSVLDHAEGVLSFETAAGAVVGGRSTFTPDRVPNSPRTMWSLQPTFRLKDLVGQEISVSATIRHRSSYTAFAQSSSLVAGYPVTAQPSLFGGDVPLPPTITRGYTLADLRVDWRLGEDNRIGVYGSVTNITNKAYPLGISQTVNLLGSTLAVPNEPRMYTVGANYAF